MHEPVEDLSEVFATPLVSEHVENGLNTINIGEKWERYRPKRDLQLEQAGITSPAKVVDACGKKKIL